MGNQEQQALQEKIRKKAATYAAEYIAIRQYLHANPELSYQEFETSQFVQEHLRKLGIPFTVMATTGVVGIIKGRNPESRCIALRADMDALPIREENEISYKSTRPGIMHACGHDVHTSCLLGAARILQELK
ncbi:MAG: M20/M25/M40 family metallo-hydrolase, partial [Flavihumibacter sp.]|nr:M20/M25/M40 family metallo-hydrolase [Flavihumibacter sp.]